MFASSRVEANAKVPDAPSLCNLVEPNEPILKESEVNSISEFQQQHETNKIISSRARFEIKPSSLTSRHMVRNLKMVHGNNTERSKKCR